MVSKKNGFICQFLSPGMKTGKLVFWFYARAVSELTNDQPTIFNHITLPEWLGLIYGLGKSSTRGPECIQRVCRRRATHCNMDLECIWKIKMLSTSIGKEYFVTIVRMIYSMGSLSSNYCMKLKRNLALDDDGGDKYFTF